MKNLAIILGVTNYVDSTLKLPACANDISVMETILRAAKVFDVYTLESRTGEEVKNDLSDLIRRHLQEDIDQVLFYFSGHGQYQDDGFAFLLQDYDKQRPAQTSLSSGELDDLLRSLNPQLAVKIIDACHSGMSYIKSGKALAAELGDDMKSRFSNCHFMFSSDRNQRSYADEQISAFTLQFARSITKSTSDDIRYRYIADFISDEFSQKNGQTPYFVSQGPLTETLGNFDGPCKTRIQSILPKEDAGVIVASVITEILISEQPDGPSRDQLSLLDLAQKRADRYVSQNDATQIVELIKKSLESWELTGELRDLYDADFNFEDTYYYLPKAKALGSWADNQGYDYFVEPAYDTEYYDAEPSYGIGYTMAHLLPQKKARKVISGISTSLSGMPFLAFRVTLKPKFRGLPRFSGWLTYVMSRKNLQIFYLYTLEKEIAWDAFEIAQSSNWQRAPFSLTEPEAITDFPSKFYADLHEWTLTRVSLALRG